MAPTPDLKKSVNTYMLNYWYVFIFCVLQVLAEK